MGPFMTEAALVEGTSVREVVFEGEEGVFLVFWVMVEEGLGCVSGREGGIKAGVHEGKKAISRSRYTETYILACACVWMCWLMWCLDKVVQESGENGEISKCISYMTCRKTC